MFGRPPRSPPFPHTTLSRSVVFWLLRRVCDSMFGRTLLAVRDNEERAAAVGYDLRLLKLQVVAHGGGALLVVAHGQQDRKSTRLNSSHQILSYSVFCFKKKQ